MIKTSSLVERYKRLLIVIVALVFATAGIWFMYAGRAATPFLTAEPETGSLSCASKISDAAASGGAAVKFGGCNPDDTGPTSLDASGGTIPDTNYAIPSGAIFMALNGNDSNAGTQAAPVKTLNAAISKTASGGTIVVRGGTDANPAIYRDWYYLTNATLQAKTFGIVNKPITIQSYPHEKAWFDGTDIVPTASWTSDGQGRWYTAWDTPSFCGTLYNATKSNYYSTSLDAQRIGTTGADGRPEGSANGPCAWKDSSKNPSNPMALDPQMVFINGAYVHEVASLAEATGNNFYYDWANKRIYIGTNPSGKTVELAARPMVFMLHTSGPSTVRGLGFTRFASHVYANNPGVIYSAGTQTIENSVFTKNAGSVLMLDRPSNAVYNRLVIVGNGGAGISGNGSRASGGTDNVTIQNSVISGNNTELFWTYCRLSCGAAGIKLNNMIGYTIKNNIIQDNKGDSQGAWCDIACRNGKYIYNIISGNGGYGIMPEISDTSIVASNLIYGNKRAGIANASANTKIYNNTIVDNVTDSANNWMGQVWVYDDPRNADNIDTANTGATAVGPDTTGTYYANNIVSGSGPMSITRLQGTDTTGTNTVPSQFFSLFDYNAYYRGGGSSQTLVKWNAPASDGGTIDYKSSAAFSAARPPFDTHSVDITSGSEPFFVNAAARDYRLRSDSRAGTGTTIPADVLSALGLSSGTNLPKGAINWPGK